jgi:hypothetical protein
MGNVMESFHINIKLASIQYEDNIYQIIPIQPVLDFVSFGIAVPFSHPLNSSSTFVSASLFLNDEKVIYDRRVYSILDLLGDIGGIIGAIEIVFSLLISGYADRNFSNSLVKVNFQYLFNGEEDSDGKGNEV